MTRAARLLTACAALWMLAPVFAAGPAHVDISFDTATWSRLTGARIIGSKTTCLQAQAEGIAADRCQTVSAFGPGMPMPYADAALEDLLAPAKVKLFNRALGFSEIQAFAR